MDSVKSTDSTDCTENTHNTTMVMSKKDIAIARRAGWRILNTTEIGIKIPSGSTYRVVQCDGISGQQHYGIIRDLSSACMICRMLRATQERDCVQHVYIEGRTTFEFVCSRGHHYLASSHKKVIGRCKMCTIEDECKQLGRAIRFDDQCTYVTADSLLRYCCSCKSEHYITYNKWNSLFSITGKKRCTYKSVIDWCDNGKHGTSDSTFNSIVTCAGIFEQLFDVRFDDCDDMNAANNKVLSGIYFTGYNRKLGLAFLHTSDPFYRKENPQLVEWCKTHNIVLITIEAGAKAGYDTMLSMICSAIVDAEIETRFDDCINNEPPPDFDRKFYRKKELIACMLAEGRTARKLRMGVK